jgi:esterase/lipase
MVEMFNSIFVVLFITVVSIVVHELAHYILLKRYTNKPITLKLTWKKITLGNKEMYDLLNDQEFVNILIAGFVAGGIINLVLSSVFTLTLSYMLILLCGYIIGSNSDIILISTRTI